MPPRIPTATYRLQFNSHFTLKQTLELIPYFHALGISDLYCSPIMKAVSGSIHGYDVVDCSQLNPEIGSEEDLSRLTAALHERQMGLILDIVPNHMSISKENQWWQDVLENGPSSCYAGHFDIIWSPLKTALRNKVLLPVLEKSFIEILENQEIEVAYTDHSFFIHYKDGKYPVNPSSWPLILKPLAEKFCQHAACNDSMLLALKEILNDLQHLPAADETDVQKSALRKYESVSLKKRFASLLNEHPKLAIDLENTLAWLNGKKGDPSSFDQLENLLKEQVYRLSDWRITGEDLNYRPFFDISSLVTMHAENPLVFADMHSLLLRYVGEGFVTGLRVDHVDGLYDPEEYLYRLQQSCAEVLNIKDSPTKRVFYIIVEKILGQGEKLRSAWPVFGTTGYDYLNQLNALFVRTENEQSFRQVYESFVELHHDLGDEIHYCKKLMLASSLASSFNLLTRKLEEICEQHRESYDYTVEGLRIALRELIAWLPVYRTYIRPDAFVQEEDRKMIIAAVAQAMRNQASTDHHIFDFIESLLLLEDPPGSTKEQILKRREFVMHFQQLTGPVAAKGVEDTAIYRVIPLASLNEVGMDPHTFGITIDQFHHLNRDRLTVSPHTLIATSTHDNKRSEDVRARINVLSEDPGAWMNALYRWTSINEPLKRILGGFEIPDRIEEYLLYQTLVGTWPYENMNEMEQRGYISRIEQYMIKALKEAKIHSSWLCSHESYETGFREFIHAVLNPGADNRFMKDFKEFVRPIAKAGMLNSLAQIVLKITSPGVPDFYQGSELWDLSLVDPDNRRPVDYMKRVGFLDSFRHQKNRHTLVQDLLETMEDGRIKLWLTSQLLNYRKAHPLLFQEGTYIPLKVAAGGEQDVVAYGRVYKQQSVIIVSGRFFFHMMKKVGSETRWERTALLLPPELSGQYCDILSGLKISASDDFRLPMPEFFSSFPMMCLERMENMLSQRAFRT